MKTRYRRNRVPARWKRIEIREGVEMYRLAATVVVCLVCLLCATAVALGQITEGGISGAVTDASGAVIADASVTVTNTQTGEVRQAVTSSIGFYRVDFLRPGEYEVKVSHDGFKTAVLTGIQVVVNNIVRADMELALGTVEQALQVVSEAPLVNTEEGRLNDTLSTRQVQDLPLAGREVYQLVLLQPGVTATLAPVISNTQFNRFNYGFSANGSTPRGNNYVVDGVSNNNEWLGGTPAISPSVDAVQEFQVQTVNFSAEYGRNNGSVVTLVTRSGTNTIHGSLYDYLRNSFFDAGNFFDTASSKTRLIQNQFGGSLGGPIRRNHTFFFFNYEGLRARDGATQIRTGETPEFRAQVAQYRQDSIANQQWKAYPAPPCIPGTEADTGSILLADQPLSVVYAVTAHEFIDGPKDGIPDVCSVAYQANRPVDGNQYLLRLDHNISDRDRLFFRGVGDVRSTDVAREQLGGAIIRGFKAPFDGVFPSAVLGETHLFSSRFVNDFRIAYARSDFGIGFRAPASSSDSYPTLYFDDGLSQFGGAITVPRDFAYNNYTVSDTFSTTLGHHTLKTGFELRRIQENSDYQLETLGFYEFNSLFTFANDDPYYAEALVDPSTGQFTSTPRHFRWTQLGAFVQDDWKVSRKLALNLGLRYDLFGVPTETQGILSNITLGPGATIAEQVAAARVGRVSNLFRGNHKNFAPRLGLAYDLFGDGKTSIRASFAMAYLEPYSNLYTNASRFDSPDSAYPFVFPYYYGGTINYSIPATPSPGFQTGLSDDGGIPGTRILPSGTDQNLRTAYSEQWFWGVEHRLSSSIFVSANYVGTAGHRLYIRDDINRFTGDRSSLDVGAQRFNEEWGYTTYVKNGSNSIYHGLNVQLRKRYSSGYMFTVNYTFGKAIDTVSDPGLGDYSNVSNSLYTGTMDVANGRLDHGPSDFDVRHRLTMNAVWDLPSPKFGMWLDKVLGGWQWNGQASFQTGRPFSVLCTNIYVCDYNGDGDAFDRPNTPSFGNTLTGLSRSDYINGIFEVTDFPIPAFGTNGNLGRNTFRGPSYAQVDSSLFKNVPIHENATLQVRAEFFNVLNRGNLYMPISSMTSPFFGRSIAAFPARQVQFALKILF